VAIMPAVRQAVISARRVPVTVSFVVLLAIAEISYALLTHDDELRFAAWASTNVARLRTEPFGPMIVSAFVVQEDPLAWLIVGGAAFAIVEWRLGWWRALVAALAAHVVGTLVSEGIVWWRVNDRALPASAQHQLDVGASYVVAGVLAAAVVVAPRLGRILASIVLVALSPALLEGITSLDVAAVGHLTALVIGVVSGLLLSVSAQKSAPRLAVQAA
jgi:membrane associated rhomboid family serine protease